MTTEITNISSFIVKELVGQGSFSEVYNCYLPDCENCMFAIKRLLSTCSSKKILNEVTALYMLKVKFIIVSYEKDCPNAVHLLGVIMENNCVDLIFPMIEYDDFTLFIRECTFQDVCFHLICQIDARLHAQFAVGCCADPLERNHPPRYQTS